MVGNDAQRDIEPAQAAGMLTFFWSTSGWPEMIHESSRMGVGCYKTLYVDDDRNE
ncbi:MAG: hypothetical protein JXA89_01100 [Anaerolineae bacterium]|nr:hypothetical protein [Anaerolineae bacterium]